MNNLTILPAVLTVVLRAAADEPIALGSRRELFVDRLLVGELKNTGLELHTPASPRADAPSSSDVFLSWGFLSNR